MGRKRSMAGIAMILILALIVFLPQNIQASAFRDVAPEETLAVFPSNLQFVCDDAFNGTDFSTVIFEENLLYIGDRAFKGAESLVSVYIPESVSSIGTDVFPAITVIYGVKESYAEVWAKENGYRFVEGNISRIRAQGPQAVIETLLILLCSTVPVDIEKRFRLWGRRTIYVRNMRPQERAELYPINYRFP